MSKPLEKFQSLANLDVTFYVHSIDEKVNILTNTLLDSFNKHVLLKTE